MSDYQHVWGDTGKEWHTISFGEKHHMNILTVFAWAGMLGVFISLAFLFVTQSDGWATAMILFMVLWSACGVAAIRIRRSKRKMVLLARW